MNDDKILITVDDQFRHICNQAQSVSDLMIACYHLFRDIADIELEAECDLLMRSLLEISRKRSHARKDDLRRLAKENGIDFDTLKELSDDKTQHHAG